MPSPKPIHTYALPKDQTSLFVLVQESKYCYAGFADVNSGKPNTVRLHPLNEDVRPFDVVELLESGVPVVCCERVMKSLLDHSTHSIQQYGGRAVPHLEIDDCYIPLLPLLRDNSPKRSVGYR